MKSAAAAAGTVTLRLGTAAVQAGTLILLARSTAISEFGLYSAAYSVSIVVAALSNLGLPAWLLRLPSERDQTLHSSVLTASLTLALVPALAGSLSATVLGGALPIAGAVAGVALLDATLLAVQNWLFGIGKATVATGSMFATRMTVLLGLGLALTFNLEPFEAVGVAALAAAAGLLISVAATRALSLPSKGSFTGGRAYWSVSSIAMAQQLDAPLIAAMGGPSGAAAYAAGFRLAAPVHIVTGLLSSVYIPRMSREVIADRHLFPRSARPLLRLSAVYAFAIALLSPIAYWLAPFLLGSQYLDYAIVFPFFFVAAAVSVINQAVQSVLYAKGLAGTVILPTSIATALVLAAAILSPLISEVPIGAVLGLLTAQVLLALLLINRVRKAHRG